jgi:hypothetical protein
MSRKKEPEEQPRREKENMDEPQEEFIDTTSVPSHTKQETEKSQGKTSKKPDEKKT